MWTDSDKERFFDCVKSAVISGATPEEIFNELEESYYTALDDIKKSAVYSFNLFRKGRKA